MDFRYENFSGFSSPGCSVIFEKSKERPSTLGGVPVFILPDSKPKLNKSSVIPVDALSPALPPPNCLSPICIVPFKKVPLVNTTDLDLISMPRDVLTPTTFSFSIIKLETIS